MMARGWTEAEFEQRERQWLVAMYRARARRRLVATALVLPTLAALASLACRRVILIRAIVEGQASRNPRHWWRMWRGQA
jgi:hypothetical protein